jgi:hypothetical protein
MILTGSYKLNPQLVELDQSIAVELLPGEGKTSMYFIRV